MHYWYRTINIVLANPLAQCTEDMPYSIGVAEYYTRMVMVQKSDVRQILVLLTFSSEISVDLEPRISTTKPVTQSDPGPAAL